jgi:hypothetical protein
VSQRSGTDGAVDRRGSSEAAPTGADAVTTESAAEDTAGPGAADETPSEQPVTDEAVDPGAVDRGVVDAGAGPAADVTAHDDTVHSRRRTALTVGGLTAVLVVPIVIAVIAVRSPPWYPLVDLAQIEMRVRDVGTSHPPMTGLGGRIFGLNTQGSHPGPVSFYLLAPVYRLLGSTPWALQVSAAVLNVAALGGTVWASHRRWGLRGALLVAAGLAVVMRMYGTVVLLYPWNPYMPVLFWILFLVCVWGVLCGDLVLLPLAVAAGCVCAQTHVPYLGLVGGVGLVVIGGLVWQYRRARRDAAARRRVVRWTLAALGLGVLLWVPVFVEQVGGDPGNISVLVDSFTDPTDQPVGASTAWTLLTEHLNPVRLLDADRSMVPPPQGPGIVLLAVWAASAVAAARLRDRTLVTLQVVVAVALLLGFITISRIFGTTWFYLTLWAFGTATLALLAVVATAAVALGRVLADRPDRFGRVGGVARFERAPLVLLGVAVLVPTALLARAAPDTADADVDESNQLGAVIDPTVDAIEDGVIAGGPDGTFLMTWADPINLGGQGLGLMLELERQGYDARASRSQEVSVRDHRVVPASDADAEIHLAVGVTNIELARSRPGSVEVAYHDPRTPEQVERYAALREQVTDSLIAAGLDQLSPEVDGNIFALAARPELPESAVRPLYIMSTLPQPIGVYTWEPET